MKLGRPLIRPRSREIAIGKNHIFENYRFNTIIIKISITLFIEIETIYEILWEHKTSKKQTSQNNPKEKEQC